MDLKALEEAFHKAMRRVEEIEGSGTWWGFDNPIQVKAEHLAKAKAEAKQAYLKLTKAREKGI